MVDLNITLPESFLEEEVRCEYTVPVQMKKVWAVELDLVSQLVTVCQKHDLKFWADAGTLLGAVRHKGFIPWDDDMDVVMFRKDYDRLLEIAVQEFTYPYFLQTYHNQENYFRGHAQLRNSRTTAILKDEYPKRYDFNQGIFIDIFVLDGVSESKLKRNIQKYYIERLKRYASNINLSSKELSRKAKGIVAALRALGVQSGSLLTAADCALRKVDADESTYIAPLNFIYETEKRIRDKHIYDETVWLDFEFIKLPAPSRYDEFLSKRYGDYMKPAQIPTTHGGVIFDTEHCYKDYIEGRMQSYIQTQIEEFVDKVCSLGRAVVYTVGHDTRGLLEHLPAEVIERLEYCDKSARTERYSFNGKIVEPPEQLLHKFKDYKIIVTSTKYGAEIYEEFLEMGIEVDRCIFNSISMPIISRQ